MNKTYIYRVEWNKFHEDYMSNCPEVIQKRDMWLTEERLHSCSAWDGSGSDKNIIDCAYIINMYDDDGFRRDCGDWWEPVRVEKCEDVLADF